MKIAVLPGDGIGKEVIPVAREVLAMALPSAEFVPVDVGHERWLREGEAITEQDMAVIRSCDCVLFGAITSPPGKPYRSVILRLRQDLDLYANIRPFRSFPGSPRPVDFVIYRENTEDLYAGLETATADEVRSVRLITRRASERIAEAACRRPGIRRLTIVHKANVMRSCELFRDACAAVAAAAGVPCDDMLVDTAAYNLVRDPGRFDTIVTTNLFGDILSDEAAALVGSLGLSPSANVGDEYALFEPVHGSAPDIAGMGYANPIAAVLSGKMLLEWAGHDREADAVQRAVNETIREGIHPRDLGGWFSTHDVGAAIMQRLEKEL